VATYDALVKGGYTTLMVYLAQQVSQFQRQGKEFAMQHLGAETELVKVMHDLIESLTPEDRDKVWPLPERMKGASPEQRLAGLSPQERLQGLSPQELLRALAPEELERLRQLLQSQTKADDSSHPQ
jgi:hypothetical protein